MDLFDYAKCLDYLSKEPVSSIEPLIKKICKQLYKELEFPEFYKQNFVQKDECGRTLLMILIQQNQIKLVKEILRLGPYYGLDINAKCNGEYTALIDAVIQDNKTIVRKLLKYKNIDTESQNIYGKTALIYAIDDTGSFDK
jgi:ankyrin repeat protein